MPSEPRPPVLAAACLLALAASGCGATASERRAGTPEEVRELVRDGEFEAALAKAEALVASAPGDQGRQAVRQEAEVALLLERARRLSFDDHDEAALEQVEAADAVSPGSPTVAAWRSRIIDKLAERWFLRGRDAHAKGEYHAAMEGYQKALDLVPEHRLAKFQLAELEQYLGWRAAQSGEYYSGGVRAFADARLSEARTSFESSRKYDDGDTSRTARRISEVDRERALATQHSAQQQALAGHWRSAAREIEAALVLDPELPGGKELAAEYEVEATVADRLRDAELASLRDDDAKARELLEAARQVTKHQAKDVEAALTRVDEHVAATLYQAGLDLEYDFRLEEAVQKYRALLASRQFYKDARARLDTLEDTIARAAELYTRALQAKTDAERRDLLRQIDLIWPEYRDVRARLDALGAQN